MMQKAVLFLLLCLSISSISCKQREGSGDPIPTQRVMLSAVRTYNTCHDSVALSYDQQGRIISSIRENTCVFSVPQYTRQYFVYDGDRVFILDSSVKIEKDTLIVDAALRVLRHHRGNTTGTSTMLSHHEYSPQGLLKSSISYYSSGLSDTTYYSFSNGDMVQSRTSTFSLYFSYYDQPVPQTGYFTQNSLFYGNAYFYKNAHLLKEVRDQNNRLINSYTYDFNSFGDVVRKLTTDNLGRVDTMHYNYTWPND